MLRTNFGRYFIIPTIISLLLFAFVGIEFGLTALFLVVILSILELNILAI